MGASVRNMEVEGITILIRFHDNQREKLLLYNCCFSDIVGKDWNINNTE